MELRVIVRVVPGGQRGSVPGVLAASPVFLWKRSPPALGSGHAARVCATRRLGFLLFLSPAVNKQSEFSQAEAGLSVTAYPARTLPSLFPECGEGCAEPRPAGGRFQIIPNTD